MLVKIRNKFKREGIFSVVSAIIKYPFRYRYRAKFRKMIKLKTTKERFTEIYQRNLWLSSESKSGDGSEIMYTKTLRSWLIQNINNLKVNTFVDAPCGDYNWMKLVTPLVDIKYVGLDIVDDIIEKNALHYASEKIEFRVANICYDEIPDCDIIMVRDCLFHLSYKDINDFLINLSKTNYKYLLTTTHKVDINFSNTDIQTGDFRLIDLFSPPFVFSAETVKDRVDDFPEGETLKREMILIEKEYVPTHLIY